MWEDVYQINMAVPYFRSFLTSLFVTCSFVSTSYFLYFLLFALVTFFSLPHFHISHTIALFSISLGRAVIARRNEKQRLCKFGGWGWGRGGGGGVK